MLNDLLAKNQSSDKLFVEDVFSTWLYTGTGASQTIANGIDLAGKGGMVWLKRRGPGGGSNLLFDNSRGTNNYLYSNNTGAQNFNGSYSDLLTAFNSTGFSLGADASLQQINSISGPNDTYASWTFRKAPKFFDCVTWSGNSTNRTISHALGSVPGMIIVKRTDSAADWQVYHRSLANTEYVVLNTTAAKATGATRWNSTTATNTVFSLGTDSTVNATGGSYVAYLFAHDAGGFGADGLQNVISCGSFTTDGSGNATVSLGYEPQFIIYKRSSDTGSWILTDTMRGWNVSSTDSYLFPNLSNAESSASIGNPTSTGFYAELGAGNASSTFIYLAIRRGPMRVPTDATKVFNITTRTGTNTATTVGSILTDSALVKKYNDAKTAVWADRLRGAPYLQTTATSAEATSTTDAFPSNPWDVSSGFRVAGGGTLTNGFTNYSGDDYANYAFRRAPGFFDVVCYTGTGAAITQSHNLGVVPELMIVKCRDGTDSWYVYSSSLPSASYYVRLNTTGAQATSSGLWNNTAPTSSVFSIGTGLSGSGNTYVAYLFASCPGVSKVGSYTGTGTTLQINCGFTNGARFVLIKRTDSTGDWYVYDSARGIVAGNDPYLLLNSTAAEVTNTDYVDAYSAGFELSSTAPAALNANGGTYIYLAIA